MIKVLVLQNGVSHYRLPFYNMLSKYVDLTVMYTGTSVDGERKFKEIECKSVRFFGFYFHPGLLSAIKDYDVVISMFDLRWISFVLAGLFAKKGVFWSHCYGKSSFINKVRIFFLKRVDAILAYYSATFDRLKEDGVDPAKMFATENTVYIEKPQNNDPEFRKNFIYVGRYQERKGLLELLYAFESILDKIDSESNLYFVGPGFENFYKEYVEDKPVESRVKFTGAIHSEEVLRKLYLSSIAYVSPKHVGLGVLHSFAYGTPVITLNLETHAPEFTNCENNFNSIILDDIGQLSSAMLALSKDLPKLKYLSENAFSLYTESRTMHLMTLRTVDLIRNLTQKSSSEISQ
ncbi:MAG: glycosyltransferase family 4 protein [Oceanospirillaceae bacterium]|nr:glycosyltransferase family 4 protein [Oceanospirillaceae bacterium]